MAGLPSATGAGDDAGPSAVFNASELTVSFEDPAPELCAKTHEDLKLIYDTGTLAADLAFHKKRGLTFTDLNETIVLNLNLEDGLDKNPSTYKGYYFVMIRNNTLFTPFAEKTFFLGGRMLWTVAFLHNAIREHNMTFPDVVFFFETADRRGGGAPVPKPSSCFEPQSPC